MPVYKSQKGMLKKIFNKNNALFLVLGGMIVVQFLQISGTKLMVNSLASRDSSLITEIGQLKQTYGDFGSNLNEVREFLRLPTSDFSFEEPEAEGGDEGKNENPVQLAMFTYFDSLGSGKEVALEVAAKKALLEGLFDSAVFGDFMKKEELTLGQIQENDDAVTLAVNAKDGQELMFFYLSKIDGAMVSRTVRSKAEVTAENEDAFVKEVMNFVSENKSELLKSLKTIAEKDAELKAAVTDQEVSDYLAENGLAVATEPREENLKMTYDVTKESGELIGKIVLDQMNYKFVMLKAGEDSGDAVATMTGADLMKFLRSLDSRNFIDQKVEEALATIESTLDDGGFNAMLKEYGLVVKEPREDEDRYYFDIYDSEGMHVSSIVVEKATAVINIVDSKGTNSENLLFFDPEFKKKTLELPSEVPEYGDELVHEDDTFNILIAGKHGNLVDTMIFAHVNETRGTVRMISIPRDLQYNGRKINSFAFYYGMPELKKVLSDITGYELDKYILIDMYAFIDVIDLIGGIDITLEQAVIDPTYRTVDDGVEGTLHYEPGDYHLGGVEALRLARSRHTSSDFARAERQQLILEAIQDKAKNFGFGDADTIYEIAKTVLNKTETDISLEEAIVYYFKYQNYTIESNDVMSSGNVLYAPPYITAAQCAGMIAAAEAAGQPRPGCESANNAYILVPRNSNWNIIKWFFREKFEGV